jgi:hypothetical protein
VFKFDNLKKIMTLWHINFLADNLNQFN